MKVWSFCENPYPEVWDTTSESLRNTLPSRYCDPKVAADILNRHLDEWVMCDELGINICVNEHHSTATCLNSSITLPLAILARQTRKARLMSLGILIANRPDPLRVAEEVALIDLYSRGRYEMGLVRGSPYEVYPHNMQPVGQIRRFNEAWDLIHKALRTTDGPFSWEGEFFHYRDVNIWPRCYQQPCPPSWLVSLSPDGKWIADKGANVATFFAGRDAKPLFDSYRARSAELGRPSVEDRMAYMGIVSVAATDELAMQRAKKISRYISSSRQAAKHFGDPPGFSPNHIAAKMLGKKASFGGMLLPDGTRVSPETASVEQLIEGWVVFAGTPDKVFTQMKEFNDFAGGVGNFLMMGQGGFMNHAETVDNYTRFAKEVLPRLKDLKASPEATLRATA
jgi:alkanesulfonate monooxygenase SsuD/methylene tetrahydromethanopterin reductase-like flavin-dependent oxidoreductase (luciferase family)